MSTDSLVDLMEKYKDEYYQTQGKNSFFKKNQKMDCAKEISQSFQLNDMIQRTIYYIPNTNKIVYNYPVFKLYANPDNYENIIKTVLDIYDIILASYPTIETHIILDSFTISAAERYKSVIKLFCNKCMTSQTKYSERLSAMYIYYTPSMMESISTLLKPFIDPLVKDRITMYSKAESADLIKALHSR